MKVIIIRYSRKTTFVCLLLLTTQLFAQSTETRLGECLKKLEVLPKRKIREIEKRDPFINFLFGKIPVSSQILAVKDLNKARPGKRNDTTGNIRQENHELSVIVNRLGEDTWVGVWEHEKGLVKPMPFVISRKDSLIIMPAFFIEDLPKAYAPSPTFDFDSMLRLFVLDLQWQVKADYYIAPRTQDWIIKFPAERAFLPKYYKLVNGEIQEKELPLMTISRVFFNTASIDDFVDFFVKDIERANAMSEPVREPKFGLCVGFYPLFCKWCW